jgi:isocitrate dehydrogenase
LTKNEDVIVRELAEAQGKPVDIGGYYAADSDMTAAVMRPSKTFNAVLAAAQG